MVLHNPNNWHWVDKNCIAWSRDYFRKEIVGLKAVKDDVTVEVTSVNSVEGDVEVCQRKGKVISLFDVAINLKFEGTVGENTFTGTIKIPEVSYDSEEDDYQFSIAVDDEKSEIEKAKPVIRTELVPKLRKKLAQFGPDLIKTHGNEIQHTGNEPIHWESHQLGAQKQKEKEAQEAKPKYFGVGSLNFSTLNVKPKFNASPEQLFDVFLTPQLVAAWSRSPPNIEPKVGGKFELFNGNVSGEITEISKGDTLKMKWRLKEWKPNHYADLIHKFSVQDGETTMDTTWTGIPVGQEEKVQDNFEEYYVKPIKVTFGYGLL